MPNLLNNYQDKKAEIIYKNNYSKIKKNKSNTNGNSVTSSFSSSDNYIDNWIIFGDIIKLLLEGKKDNSLNIEVSKNELNSISNNDLRIHTKLVENIYKKRIKDRKWYKLKRRYKWEYKHLNLEMTQKNYREKNNSP